MAQKRKNNVKKKPAARKRAAGKKKGFLGWLKGLIKRKKKTHKRATKRKGDVRKIYKTTDGYFTQNPKIKKKRRVAVIDQRKKDGALAVTKIYSKEGKSGKAYIDKPVLKPEKHSSLTQDSIVGRQVIIGTKNKEKEFQTIQARDLEPTDDKLTKKEHRSIKKAVHNDTKEHRKTYKEKMRKWHKQDFGNSGK